MLAALLTSAEHRDQLRGPRVRASADLVSCILLFCGSSRVLEVRVDDTTPVALLEDRQCTADEAAFRVPRVLSETSTQDPELCVRGGRVRTPQLIDRLAMLRAGN